MPRQNTTLQHTTQEDVKYHTLSVEEVLETLGVDPEGGLPSDVAGRRLLQYGLNTIPKARQSFIKVYIAPILNWLITIYLVSSFALLILAWLYPSPENDLAQVSLWLAVVAINCLVAMFQQYRAQQKLEALEKLVAGEARVIRDGVEMKVDPSTIVPGDILKLEQGDRVPADGRIIICSNLSVNEASLTGESTPVMKDASQILAPDVSLPDMCNMVFLGTYIATGTARVVTTQTGGRTEIGRIQGELQALNTGDIPLRKKVNLLAKYLAIAAIGLMSFSIIWTGVVRPLLSGQPFNLSSATLSNAITTAMTIMPINIPLLTTIILLTGVLAMAKKKVIVRDLSAVESLGRVSVICSDKTGTMTRNQMTVKLIWDTQDLYRVAGDGYEPVGQIFKLKEPLFTDSSQSSRDEVVVKDVSQHETLAALIICGMIDNDAEIVKKHLPRQGDVWTPIGDPTDAALLALFRKSGIDERTTRERYVVVTEYPFESELKRMSKICRADNRYFVFVKGATEILLTRCSSIRERGKLVRLTPERISQIQSLAAGFAGQGYRVISLCHKEMDRLPEQMTREKAESDLTYLGFVCIVDPPREGVVEAVNACHSAGINVVMITGDAAPTARTIASHLNLLNEQSLVVEGAQIQEMSDEDFGRVNVFARVNPEHKQIIVERYQAQNKVVAMTGDGVNDALALAMSDTGIAMGITGTDVAKEAADLIITDDSFASIVTGVREGRGLFNKIRMVIYFYIAINICESIVFFGSLILLPGINMFINDWQNLYLVVTTHSFPGLALVFDKMATTVMQERPRDSEALITRPLGRFMALNIILMSVGAGLAYWLTLTGVMDIVQVYNENFPTGITMISDMRAQKATIMMLTVLLIVESTVVLIIRRINMPLTESIREPGTNRYGFMLGLIYLAHILLMYVPLVREILDSRGLTFYFIPLTAYDWFICVLLSLPAIVGMEIYKQTLRKKGITL